jgi:hypothetical protein
VNLALLAKYFTDADGNPLLEEPKDKV